MSNRDYVTCRPYSVVGENTGRFRRYGRLEASRFYGDRHFGRTSGKMPTLASVGVPRLS